jgi:hypothetical protein
VLAALLVDIPCTGCMIRLHATSWKVAGSIPGEVIAFFFFNWPNPSNSTMALGSAQSLTEMRTRNFPGGKWRPACKADTPPPSVSPVV